MSDNPSPSPAAARPARRPYVPAISARLRPLFVFVLVLFALLGATGLYLGSITLLEWQSGRTYQDQVYLTVFLAHVIVGLLLIGPFVVFGLIHMRNTWRRKNRRAVRAGYALFAASLAALGSGVLLIQVAGLELRQPAARSAMYWAHVGTPLLACWLYWLHRLAGPPIRWRAGAGYLGIVGATVAVMVALHLRDPRAWNAIGPVAGVKYFEPSLARTATGKFIPAVHLMNDAYCVTCHADVHARWSDSAHRFSSFNNPAYHASVLETREVSTKRDGNVQASRWCAGCHDPVPFFSGAFDDPKFDTVNHPTAQAGITCTVCHAITNVNSPRGNADFTIEDPLHYPFADSDNEALQWVSGQLIKAKPSFHRKTFLKPFHKTAEFCSTCHKVSLPYELNHYKEFLRGQNHYDSYLLSGVSGHGARSFYYPPEAQQNCNGCHMPAMPSEDFGARPIAGTSGLSVHDHLFPGSNTGLAWLLDKPAAEAAHAAFLKDTARVDIFGLYDGNGIDAPLIAPLRPVVPTLVPGQSYLIDTVVRTMKLGHHFTQGTVDSNEVWVDVTVTSGGRVIGRSGGMDAANNHEVDPWSHFINVFMLDRDGHRIDRRNPQDIFTPLYNHQIPPGAAASLHYALNIPDDVTEPVTVDVKLQYRKFDTTYMNFVAEVGQRLGQPIRGDAPGVGYDNRLPVVTIATDRLTFPVAGSDATFENTMPNIPPWQRWNDYGIGLLLKGKAELRQAAAAFAEVESLGRYDGPLNLARVLHREGRLDEATAALGRAAVFTDPAPPPWTMGWLAGTIDREQGRLAEAEANLRGVLTADSEEIRRRGFDFSKDYEVINLLGQTLFDRARQARGDARRDERETLLRGAVEQFRRVLEIDPENVTAHYNLALLFRELGDAEAAAYHRREHTRYKPDDNAQDRAVRLARQRYPAANFAAEALVIYPLQRPGAPGLPAGAAVSKGAAP